MYNVIYDLIKFKVDARINSIILGLVFSTLILSHLPLKVLLLFLLAYFIIAKFVFSGVGFGDLNVLFSLSLFFLIFHPLLAWLFLCKNIITILLWKYFFYLKKLKDFKIPYYPYIFLYFISVGYYLFIEILGV